MLSRQTTILFGLLVLTLMAVAAYKRAPVEPPAMGGAPVGVGRVDSAAAARTAVAGVAATLTAVPTLPPTQTPTPTASPQPTPAVLIGAGDISVCGRDWDKKTAALLGEQLELYPGAEIFTAGDNAQSMGTIEEYLGCFSPSWGKYLSRIHPSPGNHDWATEEGRPYFQYFGDAAGPSGLGYYSYDLGDWHIISLNSNCGPGGCGEDSEQVRWLRQDLQENGRKCTLLYWHHPLWSSGKEKIIPNALAFWQAASDAHAEIVINGHDHHYERLTPLDRDGNSDPQGIRPFIVGTGGAWLFELDTLKTISEARDNTTYGVIRFMLYPGRYEWTYLPLDGSPFSDSGSGVCN